MCSGSSLHVECILPFGMLCLSAWRIMFVKMVFEVRGVESGGGRGGAAPPQYEKWGGAKVCFRPPNNCTYL